MMEASGLTTCQSFGNGQHKVFPIVNFHQILPSFINQADAQNIEQQQEKQPSVKQERVTDKKADDAEDRLKNVMQFLPPFSAYCATALHCL
jgi:hypothetical protein